MTPGTLRSGEIGPKTCPANGVSLPVLVCRYRVGQRGNGTRGWTRRWQRCALRHPIGYDPEMQTSLSARRYWRGPTCGRWSIRTSSPSGSDLPICRHAQGGGRAAAGRDRRGDLAPAALLRIFRPGGPARPAGGKRLHLDGSNLVDLGKPRRRRGGPEPWLRIELEGQPRSGTARHR